jgi:hypothetical protein
MQKFVIRDATPSDFETICALNIAGIPNTSAMDMSRLAALHQMSCYHKVGCAEGGSTLKIRASVVRFRPWPLRFLVSAQRRPTDWLHHLVSHILANLPPKGRADTG